MGRYHVHNFANCSDSELVAICDVDEARLAAVKTEFGVPRAVTKWEDVIAMDDIDAVAVALPNVLHKPVTIAAFKTGKHVLCEKPLAMDAGEANEMVAAGHKAGRYLMVHFNQRFTPETQWLKRYVDGGHLGEVYYAKTGWIRRRGLPGLGGWFTTMAKSGGGALIDIGVHALDLALWYLGFPRMKEATGSVYAKFGPVAGKRERRTFDVDDLAAALIKFENGATLSLEASWASNVRGEEIYTELLGTRAGVRRSSGDGVSVFTEVAGGLIDSKPTSFTVPSEDPQAHFARCILRGEEPIATGEQGLEVMRILDAIYASAGGRASVVPSRSGRGKAKGG
jgi:predicted dehydrogenase